MTNHQTRPNAPVGEGEKQNELDDFKILKKEITKMEDTNNDIRRKVDMILEFLTHQIGQTLGQQYEIKDQLRRSKRIPIISRKGLRSRTGRPHRRRIQERITRKKNTRQDLEQCNTEEENGKISKMEATS